MNPWAFLRNMFAPKPATNFFGLNQADPVKTPDAAVKHQPAAASAPAPVTLPKAAPLPAAPARPAAAPVATTRVVAVSEPMEAPSAALPPAPAPVAPSETIQMTAHASGAIAPLGPEVDLTGDALPAMDEPTPIRPARVQAAAVPAPAAAPEPAAPGPEPNELSAQLRAQFADAIRHLTEQLPKDQRTPDMMTLIGQLAGDPEGRLRQPPAAARRAMASCQNEETPTQTLVLLLESDPLLAKATLGRANSAYYLRGKPCVSLQEAVTRQGRQSVHNVLLQQTLGGLVYPPGGIWSEMVGKVWSHMVRTGPIARAIARLFDCDPEQAFAVALLHDVGKLAVFDRIASLRTEKRGNLDLPKPAVMRALRVLHEPLGGLCALGWNLGDDAAEAIATHHRDPVPGDSDQLCQVVWLAEHVDLASQRGEPVDLPSLWVAGSLTGDLDAAPSALKEFIASPAGAAS